MEPPAAVDFFFLAVTWLGSLHLLLPAALAVAALPDEVVDTTVYGGVSLACTF